MVVLPSNNGPVNKVFIFLVLVHGLYRQNVYIQNTDTMPAVTELLI